MQITHAPQFSGLRSFWYKRHPEARLRQMERVKAQEAEDTFWRDNDQKLRETMTATVFEDKYGTFTGWHLLVALHRAKNSINNIERASFLERFRVTGGRAQADHVMREIFSLGLLENPYGYMSYSSGYDSATYLKVTHRGTSAIRTFKKDCRDLRQRRGNYSFKKDRD